MNRFETRKKLLVTESEVYRQLIRLELQTFKVYSKRTKRRLASISTYLPFVTSGLPLLKGLFAGKKNKSRGSSLARVGALFMLGWKAYQRFVPFLGRNKVAAEDDDPGKTAAEEYLSRRL